jgi:hypothetical protein
MTDRRFGPLPPTPCDCGYVGGHPYCPKCSPVLRAFRASAPAAPVAAPPRQEPEEEVPYWGDDGKIHGEYRPAPAATPPADAPCTWYEDGQHRGCHADAGPSDDFDRALIAACEDDLVDALWSYVQDRREPARAARAALLARLREYREALADLVMLAEHAWDGPPEKGACSPWWCNGVHEFHLCEGTVRAGEMIDRARALSRRTK